MRVFIAILYRKTKTQWAPGRMKAYDRLSGASNALWKLQVITHIDDARLMPALHIENRPVLMPAKRILIYP